MILTAFASLCILLGSFLLVVGAIGVLRFPDFYTRCHAAGITDSAGAGFILLGLMLVNGFDIETFKLGATLLLLWLTSSAATHALAKSAYAQGIMAHDSKTREGEDESP